MHPLNTEVNLQKFLTLMSGTRHFKPGIGDPFKDVAIEGIGLPCDVLWLFRQLAAASLAHWHFCSYQDTTSIRNEMLSIRENIALHEVDESLVSRQIKPLYWSEFWVPLFATEQNSICVDLDPTNEGVLGQIIRVSHDSDERRWVCNSADELCGLVIEKHELGLLIYQDDGTGPELREIHDSLEFLWGATCK
jgi:hypothetical protein